MTFALPSIKRPLLAVALCYGAGVALADHFPFSLPLSLVSSFALAVFCLLPSRLRPLCLALLLVAIGAANFSLHTAVISPNDIRTLAGERIEEAVLQGTIYQTPSRKIYERGGDVSWRTLAYIELTSLRWDTGEASWQPAFGRVTISTPGNLGVDFFEGQNVEVSGLLRRPKGAIADGLFDYRNYLRRLGIYYQLQVLSTNAWKLNEEERASGPPVSQRFISWAKAALARGLPAEDEALRLEWALTLGWKPALTEEVAEPFIRAATYHIFAVDGLRIMILSGIFLSLFRGMGLSRSVSGMLVLPLLWFYACMTGFPASAIRATVMATVVIGGWALNRPNDLINSLFAAALIILVWEPSQLFQAGFQLSFCVVLCIALLMAAFEQAGHALFKADPLLPHRPLSRWQKILRSPARYLWETLLVSFAAWLGSIPLCAYYFHILTPVSAPANLLAVPFCGLVLISNLLSLLLAGWFPSAAEYYNHAGWFFMELIRAASHWSARWPAAYYYVQAPTLFTTSLYYLLLLTIGTGWVFGIKYRNWALVGLAFLSFTWGVHWALARQATSLTILPLKGGAAIFANAPAKRQDLLVNCGNENSANSILKPFLQAQGLNHLPDLLLSHGDVNHVGGAEVIWKNFAVSQIDVSPVHFRSGAYRELLEQLKSIPGLLHVIQRSNHVSSWTVLHPASEDHFALADDNAIVLLSEINGTRVLLLSDLGKAGQNALLTRQPDLRADIVVVGIPKQGEPLAEAVLDGLRPRLIVVADAEYPASARASRKLRERLGRRQIPVVYTSDSGAATLIFRAKCWELKTMDREPL